MRDADFVGVVAPDLWTAERAVSDDQGRLERASAALQQGALRVPQEERRDGRARFPASQRLRRAGHGIGGRQALADLHGRVHRARPARAAGGGGGVERRQADGLDRHAAPLRRARRAGRGVPHPRGDACGSSCPTRAPATAASTPAMRPSRRRGWRRRPASRSRSSGRARRSSRGRIFRPAGVIEVRAAPGATARSWPGSSTTTTPVPPRSRRPTTIANQTIQFHPAASPLRQGSYRGLAATANHFARETHMDELARALAMDPLELRLKNISEPRLQGRPRGRRGQVRLDEPKAAPGRGFGIAGGFEKGGYVATCAEIEIDGVSRQVRIRRVVEAFECGAVVNPNGLRNQVEGAIVQGIGGALFEAIRFENGRIVNPRFSQYRVPRFTDVPPIEIGPPRPQGPAPGGRRRDADRRPRAGRRQRDLRRDGDPPAQTAPRSRRAAGKEQRCLNPMECRGFVLLKLETWSLKHLSQSWRSATRDRCGSRGGRE